jgi:hypothetical protein
LHNPARLALKLNRIASRQPRKELLPWANESLIRGNRGAKLVRLKGWVLWRMILAAQLYPSRKQPV